MKNVLGNCQMMGVISMSTEYLPTKWDYRFMEMAHLISGWSKDPSTKVGAVIVRSNEVLSMGFNGFPSMMTDSSELLNDRPKKYARTVHAEMNAVLRLSKRSLGMRIYTTMLPCSTCAAVLITVGVGIIYTRRPTDEQADRWGKSFDDSVEMFKQTGCQLIYMS